MATFWQHDIANLHIIPAKESSHLLRPQILADTRSVASPAFLGGRVRHPGLEPASVQPAETSIDGRGEKELSLRERVDLSLSNFDSNDAEPGSQIEAPVSSPISSTFFNSKKSESLKSESKSKSSSIRSDVYQREEEIDSPSFGAVSISSNGSLGVSLGNGTSLNSDGSVGLRLGGVSFNSNGTLSVGL